MASLASQMCQEFCEKYDVKSTETSASEMINEFPSTWGVNEPQRHWEMRLHCERAMYPRPMPNLALPSREARFYWHLYSSSANHETLYQRDVNLALLATLNKLVRSNGISKSIVISEQLVRISTYDRFGRRDIVDRLEKYICQQTVLETFCIEGLRLNRAEGLQLISALKNSRESLKSLYCWRAFAKNQRPIVHHDSEVFSSTRNNSPSPKGEWWKAITSLDALTNISLNYSYIATPSGDLLLELAKKLGPNWQWLQLLCQENEIPTTVYNPKQLVLNYTIPDIAWQATRVLASSLKVQLVFIDIPEYDRHKMFFTKNTPIHTFMLSSGIDLRFRQPWYIECTLRTLWSWYPDNLVYLYLQLWHHRENLDNLFSKVFTNLPELRTLEFIGEIRTLRTLCTMCCQIRTRRCKVNHVDIQMQDTLNNSQDSTLWKRSIECLLCCFKQDFHKMGVRFDISFYPC